jgi:hypothetical protein
MKKMKTAVRKLLVIYVAFAAASVLTVQAQQNGVVSGKYLNPLQLGLLSWYGGSQPNNIGVGNGPLGVAFDGANVWVTNQADNTVTKLRASDGACVATCTFAVGSLPNGIAFDGANIWVANGQSDNVTKLRASDGACVGTCTFAAGIDPFAVAFDGADLWVTNFGSDNVTKLRASDGFQLATFNVGIEPAGVAFDGANIWVANLQS